MISGIHRVICAEGHKPAEMVLVIKDDYEELGVIETELICPKCTHVIVVCEANV